MKKENQKIMGTGDVLCLCDKKFIYKKELKYRNGGQKLYWFRGCSNCGIIFDRGIGNNKLPSDKFPAHFHKYAITHNRHETLGSM